MLDDDFYEEPPINFGQGIIHDLTTKATKKKKKEPIGFVHFNKPKAKKPRARKIRRRK